jgi:hypothetical protein
MNAASREPVARPKAPVAVKSAGVTEVAPLTGVAQLSFSPIFVAPAKTSSLGRRGRR